MGTFIAQFSFLSVLEVILSRRRKTLKMPTHLSSIERSTVSEIKPLDIAFDEAQEFFALGQSMRTPLFTVGVPSVRPFSKSRKRDR
jgi:hypothetical protein